MNQNIKIIQTGRFVRLFIDDKEIKNLTKVSYVASVDDISRVQLEILTTNDLEIDILNPVDTNWKINKTEESNEKICGI